MRLYVSFGGGGASTHLHDVFVTAKIRRCAAPRENALEPETAPHDRLDLAEQAGGVGREAQALGLGHVPRTLRVERVVAKHELQRRRGVDAWPHAQSRRATHLGHQWIGRC